MLFDNHHKYSNILKNEIVESIKIRYKLDTQTLMMKNRA